MKNESVFPVSETRFYTPASESGNAFLLPLCVGHFLCDSNYLVSRSRYDSFLLLIVLHGNAFVTLYDDDGKSKTVFLSQREFFLLDCYSSHAYGSLDEQLEFCWVHFDGPSARNYYQYYKKNCPQPCTLTHKQLLTVFEDFYSLYTPLSETAVTSDIRLTSLLTRLLADCISPAPDLPFSSEASIPEAPMEKACAYLRVHFSEDVSVSLLADMVSLTPCHFIRSFKKYCGVTPHQYLLNLRLNSARFYLRTTGMTIEEIAYACGFQSINNFCIAFKNKEGMAPGAYRKLYRAG